MFLDIRIGCLCLFWFLGWVLCGWWFWWLLFGFVVVGVLCDLLGIVCVSVWCCGGCGVVWGGGGGVCDVVVVGYEYFV